MQSPLSLRSHMQSNIGASLSSIQCDGSWHSGNRSNGDPLGKISYITVSLEKGLLVRYRCHKQGTWYVWKSWKEREHKASLSGEFNKRQAIENELIKARLVDNQMILMKLHMTWNESQRPNISHPYIRKKMIKPLGIRAVLNRMQLKERTNEAPEQYLSPGTLLVPAYCNDTAKIVGYETIMPNGRKLMRGRKGNTHLAIGLEKLGDGGERQIIYVAEGYSTAVSVFMRKASVCFVAFSTSNLLSLGKWLRSNYPNAEIVMAADNDIGVRFRVANRTLENPGVYYSKLAAKEVGAKVWIPRAIQNKKTDWNDRHVLAARLNDNSIGGRD